MSEGWTVHPFGWLQLEQKMEMTESAADFSIFGASHGTSRLGLASESSRLTHCVQPSRKQEGARLTRLSLNCKERGPECTLLNAVLRDRKQVGIPRDVAAIMSADKHIVHEKQKDGLARCVSNANVKGDHEMSCKNHEVRKCKTCGVSGTQCVSVRMSPSPRSDLLLLMLDVKQVASGIASNPLQTCMNALSACAN
eukprot:4271616-Amphidinium_carterae.1